MNRILFILAFASAASAQSISVTAPGGGTPTLSGTSYTLQSACTSCPSLYSVEYDVDGEVAGISSTPPYSVSWNTFYSANGSHSVTATARNALNATLATASSVPFTIANSLPYSSSDNISVAQKFSATMTISNFANNDNVLGVTGTSPTYVSSSVADATSTTLNVTTGNSVLVYARTTSATSSVTRAQHQRRRTLNQLVRRNRPSLW